MDLTLRQIQTNRAQTYPNITLRDYLLYLIYQNSPSLSDFQSLLDATEGILSSLNITNTLVSIIEFEFTNESDTAFTKYDAWITANPDYEIRNEIYYPNPKEALSGTPVIMVRYTGKKVGSDGL